MVSNVIENTEAALEMFRKRRNPLILCAIIIWCSMNINLLAAIYSLPSDLNWPCKYQIIKQFANSAHFPFCHYEFSWRVSIIISVLLAFPYMFLQNIVLSAGKAVFNGAERISENLRVAWAKEKWMLRTQHEAIEKDLKDVKEATSKLREANTALISRAEESYSTLTKLRGELELKDDEISSKNDQIDILTHQRDSLSEKINDLNLKQTFEFDWKKNKWFEGKWIIQKSVKHNTQGTYGKVIDCSHDFITEEMIVGEALRYNITINSFHKNKVWYTKSTGPNNIPLECELTRINSEYFIGYEKPNSGDIGIVTVEYKKSPGTSEA